MKYRALLVGALVFGVLSCSKDKLKPLSAEQSTKFKSTLSNVGMAVNTVADGLSTSTYGNGTNPLSGLAMLDKSRRADFLGLNESETGSEKRRQRESAGKILKDALNRGDCTFNKPSEATLEKLRGIHGDDSKFYALGHFELQASVTGDKCPVNGKMTMSIDSDERRGYVKTVYHVDYVAKSADLKAIVDVDQLSWDFSAEASVPKSGSPRSASGKVSTSGTLHSQTDGNLSVYLEVSGSGKATVDGEMLRELIEASGEFKFGINFKDFTAEIKLTGSATENGRKTSMKYFMNNKEVSENDMRDLVKSAVESY